MADENNGRPFWVDDASWNKSRLPKLNGGQSALDVVSAIPRFVEFVGENICGEYTIKDGLLVYHIYHKDRKRVIDQAEKALEESRAIDDFNERVRTQHDIAASANAELNKHPWWSNIEGLIKEVFGKAFKYQPFKANFYDETDSWSVLTPEPKSVLSSDSGVMSKHLLGPLKELDKLISSN